jgi:hypothetical protein
MRLPILISLPLLALPAMTINPHAADQPALHG